MKNGKWDIRIPTSLREMFPSRTGYYYKVNQEQALKICQILSKAYKVSCPKICSIKKISEDYGKVNAMYWSGKIYMYSRNHIKSIFHEFYHHLDYETKGEYNSDDRRGGASSLAWQFADHMWNEFRKKQNC